MPVFRRGLCILLALCSLIGLSAVPVCAADEFSEDPLAVKSSDFGAAAKEPAAPEIVELPEEPAPMAEEPTADTPETISEKETENDSANEIILENEPEESVPAEIIEEVPAETVAETVPEIVTETPAEEEPEEKPEPAEPTGHNGIPLYFQTDYPGNMYGSGTIANNGCSATCLAMMATYLTGHEYLPDEIARYFGGAAENNIARLEYGSEAMKLPWKKSENWHRTIEELKNGKVAIALMNAQSIFTDAQHFIILAGLTEDGKILVNDPNEANYDNWMTKRGLQEGFGEDDILLGYSGAWIFDKAAMPADPFVYYEPELSRTHSRYDVELSWEEIQLLAKVVWVEARGESREGQQAVAEVVLNRMVSGNFPDNLHDVIYGKDQFRSAEFLDKAEPGQAQYEAIDRAMFGPYVLPEDVYYFATTPETEKVWGRIGGHIFCYADN